MYEVGLPDSVQLMAMLLGVIVPFTIAVGTPGVGLTVTTCVAASALPPHPV